MSSENVSTNSGLGTSVINSDSNLTAIQDEVTTISNLLQSPTYGLEEIQTEVFSLQFANPALTGGPFVRDTTVGAATTDLQFTLENINPTDTASITINVYDLTGGTRALFGSVPAFNLTPNAATITTLSAGTIPDEFEIEFDGVVAGVYVSAVGLTLGLVPVLSNFYKHSDFVLRYA